MSLRDNLQEIGIHDDGFIRHAEGLIRSFKEYGALRGKISKPVALRRIGKKEDRRDTAKRKLDHIGTLAEKLKESLQNLPELERDYLEQGYLCRSGEYRTIDSLIAEVSKIAEASGVHIRTPNKADRLDSSVLDLLRDIGKLFVETLPGKQIATGENSLFPKVIGVVLKEIGETGDARNLAKRVKEMGLLPVYSFSRE